MEIAFTNVGLLLAAFSFGFAIAFGAFADIKAASWAFGPISTTHTHGPVNVSVTNGDKA